MSNIIKNFSEFNISNRRINEAGGVGDFIGGLFSRAGEAFTNVIKNKMIAYLYDYIGVEEGSFLGTIIEKVAQQVDFSEYGDLIMGGSIPVDKLAPKFADATLETIIVAGVRPIAQKLNIKNTNGLLYRTIEEMITNEVKKKEFHDTLTAFYTWVFGGGSPNKPKQNALFQPEVKDKSGKNKPMLDFTPEEKKKIETDPAVKSATKGTGLDVSSILASITGGSSAAGGKTPITGA